MKSTKYILISLVLISTFQLSSQQVGFLGEVKMFAGNFAPRGWAFCEGQLMPINSNQSLFSVLGTTFGGDGRTNFALPDFRGRSAIGVGTGPGLERIREGNRGGVENVILSIAQLPSHNHTGHLNIADGQGDLFASDNDYLANTTSIEYQQYKNATGVSFVSQAKLEGVVIDPTGSNQPVGVRDPYLGIRFIICIDGMFPSRS